MIPHVLYIKYYTILQTVIVHLKLSNSIISKTCYRDLSGFSNKPSIFDTCFVI